MGQVAGVAIACCCCCRCCCCVTRMTPVPTLGSWQCTCSAARRWQTERTAALRACMPPPRLTPCPLPTAPAGHRPECDPGPPHTRQLLALEVAGRGGAARGWLPGMRRGRSRNQCVAAAAAAGSHHLHPEALCPHPMRIVALSPKGGRPRALAERALRLPAASRGGGGLSGGGGVLLSSRAAAGVAGCVFWGGGRTAGTRVPYVRRTCFPLFPSALAPVPCCIRHPCMHALLCVGPPHGGGGGGGGGGGHRVTGGALDLPAWPCLGRYILKQSSFTTHHTLPCTTAGCRTNNTEKLFPKGQPNTLHRPQFPTPCASPRTTHHTTPTA